MALEHMVLKLSYDRVMRSLVLFSFAFTACLIAASGVPSAHAQITNWGPSVTSLGFGGNNRLGGVPPSVTSLGFGRNGTSQEWGEHSHFHNPMFTGTPIFNSRHHRPEHSAWWGAYYAYPVFIDSSDAYQNNPEPVDSRDEYRGGPTIFDRRGDGQYAPPPTTRRSEPAPEPLEAKSLSAPLPLPELAKQPQTVLVFKDGHQASVDNYAIVGATLYDLSDGKRHKIALADLDLKATAQQNDDRGVDFELPVSSASN
jgi:hypothetical protein